MLVNEKSKVLKKFASKTLAKPERVSITSAVYNYNGTGLYEYPKYRVLMKLNFVI